MMKNLKYILLAVILFPLMGIVSSCSDETETEGEFDNWQEKNEAALAQWASNANYRKILTYSKDINTPNLKNSDYIYVEVLESGSGTECPLFTDTVRVAYRGHFIPTASYSQGYVFSQTYLGVFDWKTAGVIDYTPGSTTLCEGLSTALQYMHKGDYWRVHIPYSIGYGTSNYTYDGATILGYSNLVYEISMYDVWHPEEKGKGFK